MPSPLGHALGGFIVGLLAGYRIPNAGIPQPAAGKPNQVPVGTRHPAPGIRYPAVVCVVAACLPDIDFLWGRHNMETHSIGFALLVGLLVFAWTRSRRLSVACLLAVGSHVLFDWLGSDDFPPLGVMALWPFSSEFYFADAYVFATISRRYQLPGFLEHNVLAVLRELAILVPIAAIAYFVQSRRAHDVTSAKPR
jgi:membrane-bound metal-dependent hydrolase YbcI (DUF457 family)